VASKRHLKKKLKVIKGGKRDPNVLERNDMTQKIDATVVEAICRTLGRTDWDMDDAMFKRGFWQPYDTGEEVFLFDGQEKFLIGPWEYNILDDTCRRKLQWLFDRHAVEHHTAEDEKG
jgi:hypothetical protein